MGCSVCLSSCALFVEAAGKIAREEGKHDLGSTPEDSFPDNLSIPPTTAELVSNPHSSRSEHIPHRNLASPPQTVFMKWKYERAECNRVVLYLYSGIIIHGVDQIIQFKYTALYNLSVKLL